MRHNGPLRRAMVCCRSDVVGPTTSLRLGQTRPPRGVRVWATLASTGRAGYRRLIDHDLDLAERLAAGVRDHPELELAAAGLSVVCFRYRAAAADSGDLVQAEIARRLQSRPARRWSPPPL